MDQRAAARFRRESTPDPPDRSSPQSARESLPAWQVQSRDPAASRGQYALGRPDSFRDLDASRTDPLANRDRPSHANLPRRRVSAGHSKSTPSASPHTHEIPDAVQADRADHGTWSPSGSDSAVRAGSP